jgi:hypothetical protein
MFELNHSIYAHTYLTYNHCINTLIKQAVTCDDFRFAMSDASQVDLTQFERWYTQAGTPKVTVDLTKGGYDPTDGTFKFTMSQVVGSFVENLFITPSLSPIITHSIPRTKAHMFLRFAFLSFAFFFFSVQSECTFFIFFTFIFFNFIFFFCVLTTRHVASHQRVRRLSPFTSQSW